MLNQKFKTMPAKLPVDYMMDPQPWNPKCNSYLYKLSEIIAEDADKKRSVEKAYKDHTKAIKGANSKLIDDLKKALGNDWKKITG